MFLSAAAFCCSRLLVLEPISSPTESLSSTGHGRMVRANLSEPLGVVGGAVELRAGLVQFEGAVAGDGFGLGEERGDLV